ncbi:RNA polymerase sigma factor [Prolixibacteraceae bacterium Z1-6]|uniref:RNA polymerase sigma factor n=1 Tax=Draconibacterium aestuarii TaxID=2998507 RepID=A0A9X3FGQ9_9BACT|nr:RNA polymerase sigma factor [Prolixibacteraceae bacterium Z1-6]
MVEELYIKKILNGDTEAFRYFVTQYKDLAFSLAVSVVKDEFTAADVVQEAFVKAFEHLKSFKGKSKFSSWLMRIVINEAYKVVRRNKVNYTDELLELEEISKDALKEADQKFYVNEVLKIMAPNESLVLRLYYLNENNILEICEMTGWAESKVKVTLHRARKSMEQKMKKLLSTEVESLI